jgi:glycosyltransferase involved in cell wall biosynthesis
VKKKQQRATVVITTKNRKEDLEKSIRSCLSQSVDPEILVFDDGSSDGTAELVRDKFPTVKLESEKISTGYIVKRNRGAQMAQGKYVFSIDDDAEFSTPKVIEDTVNEMERHPRAAAVAIPCIDVNRSPDVRQPFPKDDRTYATSEFIGTAYAVRKDLFCELSGFRECLIHQGEERDYAIRALNAGYYVLLGSADPILHHESPKRDTSRMDFYGRRNDVLFAWSNSPWPYLPVHLIGTTVNGLAFGFKCGRPLRMTRGLMAGWLATTTVPRNAVSKNTYKLYRELRTQGFVAIDELPSQFQTKPLA